MCNDFSIALSTDSTKHLSEAKLCEIVGVSQQYRQSLCLRKLVDRAGKNGCTRTDALELAAIQRLSQYLSPNEVGVAWRQLRDELREALPGGQLDVVFDRPLGTATIVRTDGQLRAAVISGRPMLVIELGPRLREVLDAFSRWASAGGATTTPRAQRDRRPRSA